MNTAISWDAQAAQSKMSETVIRDWAAKFPVMALEKDGKPTGSYRWLARVSFPHLFHPTKMEGSPGQPTYNAVALMIPGYDLSLLTEAVKATRAEKWPKGPPSYWKNPFKKQDDKAEKLAGYLPGGVFMSLSANSVNSKTGAALAPPKIYDLKQSLITNEADIYPGVWGFFVGRPYNYDAPGNCGTKFSLDMFIKFMDDTPLASGQRTSVADAMADLNLDTVIQGQTSGAASSYDDLDLLS